MLPATCSWTPRRVDRLLTDQLTGLAAWNRAQADERLLLQREATTRAGRMDAARRLEVLDVERRALHDRALADMHHELACRGSDLPRAVVAHRQPWFASKVTDALADRRVSVVECLEDGAEAMAAVVLHQPDLLVVGELLPRVPAAELVRRTRELSPATVIAVQVEDSTHVAQLCEAGAHAAVTRRIPPLEVADAALRCLLDGEEQISLV